MDALEDKTTARQSELMAGPAHPSAGKLVTSWAQGRRRITPWAYPRLRALGAMRLAIGIFLVGIGAMLLSLGHDGWAAIPLAGAVLNLAIGSLDTTVARSAYPRM